MLLRRFLKKKSAGLMNEWFNSESPQTSKEENNLVACTSGDSEYRRLKCRDVNHVLLQRSEKYPEVFPNNESFLLVPYHGNLTPATWGQWGPFQPGGRGGGEERVRDCWDSYQLLTEQSSVQPHGPPRGMGYSWPDRAWE